MPTKNRPLILITNDDSHAAKGLKTLIEAAAEYGDILVMAPEHNSSGLSHSFTTGRPLRVREINKTEGIEIYACDGTPVDCVKLAIEHFCPRRPDLVLSGINHGSNSSVNVLYSGTMGAVIEASTYDYNAIGFSLLNHNPDADFRACIPFVKQIITDVLRHGLPTNVSLNVNFPNLPAGQIKGIRVCHEAKARWADSFEKRIDPYGRPYWWLTGRFICNDYNPGTDEGALADGYVSIVPIQPDYTCYSAIEPLAQRFEKLNG
ncbi:MAG: 5'/3'-nucleotidase SurE [Bacteroidales bacterium]|nr:5'/3'-nucleotidase SurE [Bacteroidales bacterium]